MIEVIVLAPIVTESYIVTDEDGTEHTETVEVAYFPASYGAQKFGRKLSDAQAWTMRVKDVETAQALLSEYPDVQLIGAWDIPPKGQVGEQVMPLDKDLYLEVMPDEITRDDDGNEISRTRPTELQQVNLWGAQYPAGRDLS